MLVLVVYLLSRSMGIVGEILREGFPILTKLKSMLFVTNTTFTGTFLSEYEAYITSLHSIELRNFDSSAHKIAQEEVKGFRSISPKGADFIPTAAGFAILKLGIGVLIAKVAYRIFPILNNMDSTSFKVATH